MRIGHLVAAGACLTIMAGAGCSSSKREERREAAPPVVQGVVLDAAALTPLQESTEVVGTVRAGTSAAVAARIPGTVSLLMVREGDRVARGQTLARVEAGESLATAAGAEAGIEESARALDEATARKRLVEATFERYRRLFDEQAISRQEFEVRQTERDLAFQGVARAEARLKQAREQSRAAGVLAGHSKITAPISGVVTARQADLGATVFPGQPLFTIEAEGSYLLELSVPESQLSGVKVGAPVQVTLDALSGTATGSILQVVPSADPASRTFTVKVRVPLKGLRSGMFGRAAIPLPGSGRAILVKRSALVERGALTSLWVVDANGIARLRLVKPGKIVGDRVAILGGLSEGEKVAVAGIEKLSEGARVK